jgi:hypothetical protein
MRRAGLLCLSLLLVTASAQGQSDLPPLPDDGRPLFMLDPVDPALLGSELFPDAGVVPGAGPLNAAMPGGGFASLVTLFDAASPLGLGARVPFAYSVLWQPSRPVRNQATDLGSVRQDAVLRLPLWLDGPDSIFGSFGGRHVYTNTDAVLPNSGRRFPVQLWDIRTTLLYRRQLAADWSVGAGITALSPSDKPFRDGSVITYAVLGFLQIPAACQGDSWLVTVAYSPIGEVRFPIPGLAYQWNPSDRLQATIGVPFALMWQPFDTLRFDVGYLPLRRIRSQITWDIDRGVSLYTGFEWWNEFYLLFGRADRREQLFYYEKRIPVGVRVYLFPNWVLDLSGGYGFDRFYFAGRSYRDRHQDRIAVGSGVFLQARLAFRF